MHGLQSFGTDTPLGFIGLGVMGRGMAHCLLRAGYSLHVHARRDDAAQGVVAAGAQRAASSAEVGRRSRLVFLCLSDDAAVDDVLFGPEGLASGLAAGSVVIDTSTIAASSARGFAQRLAAQGVSFLDAPISGGQQGAEAGTLAVMVGGPAEVVDACRPVLQAFGKAITHVGATGAGQAVKACNQVAVAGAMLGVADAVALAKSQGVDPDVMREVLMAGTARSVPLERQMPRIVAGDHAPGFRARLMRKDLRIALETAAAGGTALQGARLAERLVDELCESGRAELDWNAVALVVQEKKADLAESTYLPLRLAPGSDLRRALEQAAREAGTSAFVVSGIGSLADARLRFAGAKRESVIAGDAEIVALAGTVTPDGAHLHMTVADARGQVSGGHVAYGNIVRTTAEVLLAPLPRGTLGRAHDASTGYAELVIRAPRKETP